MRKYGYREISDAYYREYPNEVDVMLQVSGSKFTVEKLLYYLVGGYFTDLGEYGESVYAEEEANGWTNAVQKEYHHLKNATVELVRNYMNPQLWAFTISYFSANDYMEISNYSTIDLQEVAVKLADMILAIVFDLYETETYGA